jgi:endonuclease-3
VLLKEIGESMMDERERANKILQILREKFTLPELTGSKRAPFQTLIRTVLSQATNDRNQDRAYKNLSEKYEINPKTLATADVKEIEKAIRVGGLYRNKSRRIKELSKVVLERFNGSLDFVYSDSIEKARSKLMSIPGVGPKTADVVVLFSAKKPTVPIDTHVNRVSKRLRLAPLKGDYEDVRNSLESFYAPEDYLSVHLLLISLGRTYCKARNPMHKVCPVSFLCATARLEEKQPDLHRLHGSRDYP